MAIITSVRGNKSQRVKISKNKPTKGAHKEWPHEGPKEKGFVI